MDFYYCEEYLTSISNKILLWQSEEKQIFIQLTLANWQQINHIKMIKEKNWFKIKIPSGHAVLRRRNVVHITEFSLH